MEIIPDDEYCWVESEGREKLDYVFDKFEHVKKRHHRTEGKLSFVTPEERNIATKHGYNLTYGLIFNIHDVLSQIPNIGEYNRFIDLGSGIGRIVLQVFLTTDIQDVIGIELVRSRFEKSREYVMKLCEKYPEYKLVINDDSEIQLLYTEKDIMKTLTIFNKNMHEQVYDTEKKSIVNSHMLTKNLTEYKLFMNTFTNSFCVSMYPLNEKSVTHHIKTDFKTPDARGYPFSLTNFSSS